MPVFALSKSSGFPDPGLARDDGLLAVGGDLSEQRLLNAYCMGIFPWYNKDEPILWWSPDPRLILKPIEFHISKSLKKILRQKRFAITFDKAFEQVALACALVRVKNNEGTWIMPEMVEAYTRLHNLGFAHSVEAWEGGKLAGGLYGVSLGRSFFGESMFFYKDNASKAALAALVRFLADHDFDFIDCQVTTAHMLDLGARLVSRPVFLDMLKKSLEGTTLKGNWK